MGVLIFSAREQVGAFQDTFFCAPGHGRHGIGLIGHREVVKDALLLFVHAANAITDNDGNFVGKGGIEGVKIGHRVGQELAIAVLMLQAFAGQRGATRSAADQEAARARVAGGPDEVTDALESEHGIKNEEWNRGDAVRGVGGSGGDEGGDGAGLGDSFLENLAVGGFFVVKQRLAVHGIVELADVRIDSHLAKERFHAEGAGLVGNNGHDELAEFLVAQELCKHADESHGGGDFAAVCALEEFLEEIFGRLVYGDRIDLALGNIPAQGVATFLQVLHFDTVFRRFVKGRLRYLLVGYWYAEAGTKFAQLVFIQLFLLVCDVAALAGFAETVTLDGFHQDHRRRALVFDGGFVCGVDLFRIVAAEAHFVKLLVGEMLDHLEQAAIDAEEVFAEIGAGFDAIFLVLAVHDFAHALDQKRIAVFFEQGVPIAAPENFDDVPSGAAKDGFQFLDDLAVTAHGAVEPLQIAVDDEDQVIELFAGGQGDGAERLRFVSFAIADEGPDFAIGAFLEPTILEIAIKPGLVDGHDGTEPHGDGRKFPEIGHEPGMRVRRKAAAGLQFAAKVLELIHGDAAFEIGACVNSG